MMSQSQNSNDRVRRELDFEVNRQTAADIRRVAGKLNALVEKVGDLDDELRTVQREVTAR
jgi:uncharacterized membrane protein